MENIETKEKDFKLYSIFTGIFVTVLILVAPLASKFIAVGPFVLSGATLVFPITFIFNDILTEVYGYQRSRKIIWIGMGCQIFAAFMFFLVGIWPAADFWANQVAYDSILGIAPRIFLASIGAYFFSEFTNSLILSKMKYWHQGKRGIYQGLRFIVSTIAGEFVDSIVFMVIAFIGILPASEMIVIILTIWIAKVLYEVVVLPFTTRFANYVKKVEGVDKIDYPAHINYNPFSVFFSKKNLPPKYQ
jgi:queuosine precursor transporter